MRAVIQRVKKASVSIQTKTHAEIGEGLVVFTGISPDDTQEDIQWLGHKILNLRIFPDENQKMNRSVLDIQGEILIISQFTLYALLKKGFRPSYSRAAPANIAIPLYEEFLKYFHQHYPGKIKSGKFGEDMKISLINDGPVTIILDSKNKTL